MIERSGLLSLEQRKAKQGNYGSLKYMRKRLLRWME